MCRSLVGGFFGVEYFEIDLNANFSESLRALGGREAEREERLKWDNADHKRIMDSVNSLLERRNRYLAEKQEKQAAQSGEEATEATTEFVADSNIFDDNDNVEHPSDQLPAEEGEVNEASDKQTTVSNSSVLLQSEDKEKETKAVDDEADEDGLIEVKINRHGKDANQSIFSNKLTQGDGTNLFHFLFVSNPISLYFIRRFFPSH